MGKYRKCIIASFIAILILGLVQSGLKVWAEHFIANGNIMAATTIAPFHYRYLYIKGLGQFKRKQCDAAIKTMERVLILAPNEWDAKNITAICYIAKGKIEKAKQIWKDIIEQWPHYVSVRDNLERLNKYSAGISSADK